MKINPKLNTKLKQETLIFEQYLSLMSAKGLLIANDFEKEAQKAQIDFLKFYLDSVTNIIEIYASDTETDMIFNEQFNNTQALIRDENPDTRLCIKKMEDTSSYWSSLCY
jgi:hypothetical protein